MAGSRLEELVDLTFLDAERRDAGDWRQRGAGSGSGEKGRGWRGKGCSSLVYTPVRLKTKAGGGVHVMMQLGPDRASEQGKPLPPVYPAKSP